MVMNKQIESVVNVTYEDYRQWCKENNKSWYMPKVRADFFAKIQDGRLVKDATTGKIVKKKVRR